MKSVWILAGLLLTTCIGCSATIVPPVDPVNPKVVFVTNYGRHSSILLPALEGHYIEYAFGDWGWFALRRTGPADAVGAMFFSSDSALGRRQLFIYDEDPGDVAMYIGAKKVLKLEAAGGKVDALRAQLDALYQQHLDTVTFQPASQLWFVRYDGGYNAFHNCNHVTAKWLRELGCGIRGNAMFSTFKLDAVKQKPATQTRDGESG